MLKAHVQPATALMAIVNSWQPANTITLDPKSIALVSQLRPGPVAGASFWVDWLTRRHPEYSYGDTLARRAIVLV